MHQHLLWLISKRHRLLLSEQSTATYTCRGVGSTMVRLLFKCLTKMGLKEAYTRQTHEKDLVHCVLGLPLLPPGDMLQALQEIRSSNPSSVGKFKSVIFQSCIFQPFTFVRQFLVPNFPALHFRPSFSSPAFSAPPSQTNHSFIPLTTLRTTAWA